jgi:hypothetical protein
MIRRETQRVAGRKVRRRTGGNVKIAHSSAFVLRGTEGCSEVKVDQDGYGYCKQGECKEAGDGSYCQLFRRKKRDKEDPKYDKEPWSAVPLSHQNVDKHHKPDEYEYKCFCVTPILYAGKLDGFEVNHKICEAGLCGMTYETDLMEGKISCSGDCADKNDCQCTMFSLQVKKVKGETKYDPSEAKWEKVLKAKVSQSETIYYRCFCIKKAK